MTEMENHISSPIPRRIRKAVRRDGADRYLLYTLLSFAASVSVTRLFLQLTGYPQIGNNELHIAHVLWGGLLLYIAALIPLLFANRWVYTFSAIVSGIGIGLFIDEVGKFITQTNDYFYPPAAPIIYALFLFTVLVYSRVRRHRVHDVRSELYAVLDGLEEVLDHDLSEKEKVRLTRKLDKVTQYSDSPDVVRLATELQDFVNSETLMLVPEPPTFWDRLVGKIQAFEKRWIGRKRLQAFLAGGLLGMSVWSFNYPMLVIYQVFHPQELTLLLAEMVQERLIRSRLTLGWFEARLALEFAVGLMLLAAAVLLVFGKQRRAIGLGILGLLLSLTTVNLLRFYFDQFSTIITATVQLAMLLTLSYYRSKYVQSGEIFQK